MNDIPAEISQADRLNSSWIPMLAWAIVHFLLCMALLLFMLFIVPRYVRMFMEFGIALNQLTQATVVSADRTIKLWPVALFICALYPCLSSGLMFVAQKRKSLFRLVAIGMALIPSLLLFLALVSLLMPWLEVILSSKG